jgi:aryl-alcohol dehydrogenase-like predicted oxidoreductase
MQTRRLGRSKVEVSRIILGCGNFGGVGSAPEFFGRGETREASFAIMDAARELGITTFDTADAYGGGRSEAWIGEWLRERRVPRGEIVLSTKVFQPMDEGRDYGLAPARVRRQLDSSLERLDVEYVDLYLTHGPDPETPLADTLTTFEELRAAGKIRAIGGSNLDAEAVRDGLGTYEWVQNSYSLLDRGDEAEVLPLCRAHGLGYTPFSPLAGGWLTGKYRRGEPYSPDSRMAMRPEAYAGFDRDEMWDAFEAFERAATERGVDPATLGLAWLLAQPDVTAVIVGPRRPEHLEPARRALELHLTGAEAAEIAALFPTD